MHTAPDNRVTVRQPRYVAVRQSRSPTTKGGLISDSLLILRAADFAARKHIAQRRKGADRRPYINHPVAVATLLAEVGGVTDARILAAALLHDTIEDTETSPAELASEFGTDISAMVLEVTDDKNLPAAERKSLQIQHASSLSHAARLIKLADKTSNVHDVAHNTPAEWTVERRHGYFLWAERVVDRIRGTNQALEARFDEELQTALGMIGGELAAR